VDPVKVPIFRSLFFNNKKAVFSSTMSSGSLVPMSWSPLQRYVLYFRTFMFFLTELVSNHGIRIMARWIILFKAIML